MQNNEIAQKQIEQANFWLFVKTINEEQHRWLLALAGDEMWYDISSEIINVQNGEKNETNKECTCPIYRLTQQGCPKLRGEKECAKE